MPASTVPRLEFEQFWNIIDGRKCSSDDQHHGINPATRDELWPVPIGNQQDVNEAVGK